jgi:hypothetical protein
MKLDWANSGRIKVFVNFNGDYHWSAKVVSRGADES